MEGVWKLKFWLLKTFLISFLKPDIHNKY